MKTILDIQSEIEAALEQVPHGASKLPDPLKPLIMFAPPKGYRAQVSLRHAKKERQVKRNAPAESWSPHSGLIVISYKLVPAEATHTPDLAADSPPPFGPPAIPAAVNDPTTDIVTALARAELDPQLGFISLKWFRDTYLPQQGYPWTASPDERQRLLASVIDRRWILTSRVANPKNPQYPVTAIKVNRPLPEVRKILDRGLGFRSEFDPIEMPGEPLSQTALRERR